jgi:hypothetical protein
MSSSHFEAISAEFSKSCAIMSVMERQPINQEVEARIGKTVDIIASADFQRFTGFEKLITRRGSSMPALTGEGHPSTRTLHPESVIDPDAAAIFIDKDKPEGQQEVRVPMRQLAETFHRIADGLYDYEKHSYSFQVGGQRKT